MLWSSTASKPVLSVTQGRLTMQSKVITVISSVVNLAQIVPDLPAEHCCGWRFALPFETKMIMFALLTFRISTGCAFIC